MEVKAKGNIIHQENLKRGHDYFFDNFQNFYKGNYLSEKGGSLFQELWAN